ncbi:dienelactone hydrolase family protein [Xylariomycetidae sp. FL2044]|nr:dienelactone hydrolase family protein [Xylariomycetidae sp. FL2044]
MACPDCFKGAIHDGAPIGTTTKLHGLDAYVVEPVSGNPAKGIVVIAPDAFGWDFVNIRLMADNYARKKDYRVYAPDFMNGNSAPISILAALTAFETPAKGWMEWFMKPYHVAVMLSGFVTWMIPNRIGKSFPIVKKFMEDLRRNEAARLPVGVAGFCWGGKHAVLLAEGYEVQDKPLIDASFTAHPSLLTHYADVEKVTVPLSIAAGTMDNQMTVPQAEETRRILEAKPDGQKGEVKIFEGYGHGFACRADPKNTSHKGAEDAEDQALAWFEKCFAKVSY